MQQSKQYVVQDWQLGFEHPDGWSVEPSGAAQSKLFRVKPESAPGVEIVITRLERLGKETEAILKEIVENASKSATQFKLLKQIIESKTDKRGAAIYQHVKDGVPVVSQEIAVPVASGSFIVVSGVAPTTEWKTYAKLFHAVAVSVKALAVTAPDDVEIVFTDGPVVPAPAKPVAPVQAEAEAIRPPEPMKARTLATLAEECEAQWATCPQQGEVLAIVRDDEMAKIIWAAMGAGYRSWLATPARALQNKTPLQCIRRAEWKRDLTALLLRLNAGRSNLRELAQGDAVAPPPRPAGLTLSIGDNNSVRVIDANDPHPLETAQRLLLTPPERRDNHWFSEFHARLVSATFYVPERYSARAPNGFPFFWMYTYAPPDFGQGRRLTVAEAIREITEDGLGLAVVPQGGDGWYCSFGNASYFRTKGTFIVEDLPASRPEVPEGSVMVGEPSDAVLPPYVRKYLKSYLQEKCGIRTPKVFLYLDPAKGPESWLMCNLYDGNIKGEQELHELLQVLTWFMMPNIGVSVTRSEDFPPQHTVL